MITDKNVLRDAVRTAVNSVKITDIHTHLYSGSFGDLLLWGVDELLTYHYLIAILPLQRHELPGLFCPI